MKQTKKRRLWLAAVGFWLVVWQCAAMAIGQEVFLLSPVQALGTMLELLPQAEFWQRVGFSAGRILLGFGLGAVCSVALSVAAERWVWMEALLAPVMQLVKATPVASFIILALVWVSGSSLSILISFLVLKAPTRSCWKWRGCSACRWDGGSGPSGCLRCCLRFGRDAVWHWASAGRAALRRKSSACRTAALATHSTGQRSPFRQGNCLRGRLLSSC